MHQPQRTSLLLLVVLFLATGIAWADAAGTLTVQDGRLVSDGSAFTLKGAQIRAYVAPRAQMQRPNMREWRDSFGAEQLDEIRAYGANAVRFIISQDGLDPESSIYDPAYLDQVSAGVALALSKGLRVIVVPNWEEKSGAAQPQPLPDRNTVRVWERLAPLWKDDRRVMLELYNEPGAPPSREHWKVWLDGGAFRKNPSGSAVGMQKLIDTIRKAGAKNVILVPGLKLQKSFEGAPMPSDPLDDLAFSVHTPDLDAGRSGWERDFGYLSARHPVVLTEWVVGSDARMCTNNAPVAAKDFLRYLKERNIGISSRAWEDPDTSFVGFRCREGDKSAPRGGPGRLLKKYYTTGEPEE